MIYLVLVALILVVGFYLYTKLRSSFFKAKDQALIKEDEALQTAEQKQKAEIDILKQKLGKPIEDLTPEQIEDFWKKDNKE